MASYLITFKPASENPDRGWPLERLQELIVRLRSGKPAIENWRFRNAHAVPTDRVFLLLQGKRGPAIIGFGRVAAPPVNVEGTRRAQIQFEALIDPAEGVFAARDDLRQIEDGQRYWNSQSSGVELPADIAQALELLVASGPRTPSQKTSNPDWTRDELIVALDVYLRFRPNPQGKESGEIQALSRSLRRLGEKLFSPEERSDTFRNENGVYMKLMNLRRLDPQYTADGSRGLVRGSKAEEEVWSDFADDPVRCGQVARAILASVDHPDVKPIWASLGADEELEEASEGRLLTRQHMMRERNRRLAETKRKQAMRSTGGLICEACGFDFEARYGDRGHGFVECHHTKPLATLEEGQKTHVSDLALVCANCHRIIHRARPWLSIAQLKNLLRGN